MSHRILIADDEPNLRFTLGFALQRAGHDVSVAADGHEALTRMREQRPDLLLAEAQLPGIDGHHLASLIRDDPALHDVPVVLMSARSDDAEVAHGLAAGADAVLAKPFPAQLLRQRVDELLLSGHVET